LFARTLGTRLAELHAVLAKPSDDPAFDPEIATDEDVANWTESAEIQLTAAFDILATIKEWQDPAMASHAALVEKHQARLLKLLPSLSCAGLNSLRTRVHGDFHLGQVLVASGDAVIIDFEGEPSKPVQARRAKTSPLRDVAGLLRSFQYAAATAAGAIAGGSDTLGSEGDAAFQRFVDDVSNQFLTAYRAVEAQLEHRWVTDPAAEAALLDLFLLEKSAYEICYEAANRPTWLAIPLRGLVDIAVRLLAIEPEPAHAE
jgi:maltose alpha-D-glucosyltransferase/alpha-amylase